MIRHPYRWKQNPHMMIWERGKLRVSHMFLAQADWSRPLPFKKRRSIEKLAHSLGLR